MMSMSDYLKANYGVVYQCCMGDIWITDINVNDYPNAKFTREDKERKIAFFWDNSVKPNYV